MKVGLEETKIQYYDLHVRNFYYYRRMFKSSQTRHRYSIRINRICYFEYYQRSKKRQDVSKIVVWFSQNMLKIILTFEPFLTPTEGKGSL